MGVNATRAADDRRALISLQGVSKEFAPGQVVLDDISAELPRGEFLALIGPSGCGKSTLLKLIAGLISPSAGSLCVGGGAPSASEGKLGFVFQDANLLPWLDIRDNVALPLKLAGLPRAQRDERAEAMLEMVGLSHALGRYPRELSGGMKMRVSIARALATQPEILLLDEPFGALDEMTRDSLNEELLRLRELQGWTGVFVTHSVAEAVFLASRIMVLSANPGRIHALLDIDLPYPRTAHTRTDGDYHAYLTEVTRSLHSVGGHD
ncbi:ABC transporter ATP-binding protein [Mangrovimicrobium sediminis]|uniref:ABC transporter ATP-binding protein n=1 Tax=Mangrovimicrobium sediminis TaxID=2562682 RepID=A0A4Z0M539_9GAMM|nr:ABC transporter ATP-binding protein [Haliea sp. SAOS-164]TGD74584.1 ABC transporter ATP-binding protein [Haliea sp. SAOS-164]